MDTDILGGIPWVPGWSITTYTAASTIGALAIATGAVGVLAVAFFGVFCTAGRPSGTLSDISNGLLRILTGVVAALPDTDVWTE